MKHCIEPETVLLLTRVWLWSALGGSQVFSARLHTAPGFPLALASVEHCVTFVCLRPYKRRGHGSRAPRAFPELGGVAPIPLHPRLEQSGQRLRASIGIAVR